VQFANLNTGLRAFSPPTVGSNFIHWWERSGGTWVSNTYANGTPGSWGAQIIAAPTTPPRLTAEVTPNQMFRLGLLGDPGLRTTLLASTNSLNWSNLMIVTNPANPPLLLNLPTADMPSRFFRATSP
jgi:hypothetical protein